MTRITFSRTMLFLTILFCISPRSLCALGPWRAQVVDAETKEPLEGVIVVPVWSMYMPDGGLGTFGYADSDEVVTSEDGRFTIAARNYSATNAFILEEPQFFLFKLGYGLWRFRGEEAWLKLDPAERRKRYEEAGKQFEDMGVVIELPSLKTPEERLRFYRDFVRYQLGNVPSSKIKRWKEAEETERAYLGL